MKKKKMNKSTIVALILLAVGLICLVGSSGDASLIIFGLVLMAAGGVILYLRFRKIKAKADAEENKKKAAAEAAAHRAEYIAGRCAEFNAELEALPREPLTLQDVKINRRLASKMPEVNYYNVTARTNVSKLFPLVVIDTETTGIKLTGNYIVEVSAIKYEDNFTPVSCFTTLINPGKPIPADSTKIHGITDEMVADAPTFSQVAGAFSDYVKGCTVVGHNLPFDLGFLYVSGADFDFDSKFIDTLKLSRKALSSDDVDNYQLGTLCESYNIFRDDAHRSLSDAYATGKLLPLLINEKMEA